MEALVYLLLLSLLLLLIFSTGAPTDGKTVAHSPEHILRAVFSVH